MLVEIIGVVIMIVFMLNDDVLESFRNYVQMLPSYAGKIQEIVNRILTRIPDLQQPSQSRRRHSEDPIKFQIAAGQQWKCAECRRMLPETFELDQIDSRMGNVPQNLQVLCVNCYNQKQQSA